MSSSTSSSSVRGNKKRRRRSKTSVQPETTDRSDINDGDVLESTQGEVTQSPALCKRQKLDTVPRNLEQLVQAEGLRENSVGPVTVSSPSLHNK